MTMYQLGVLGLAVVFLYVLSQLRRQQRLQVVPFLFWTILTLGLTLATAAPQATGVVAKAFGIGRGADLVFYSFIIVSIMAGFLVYLRLKRLNDSITILVREHAILRAELGSNNKVMDEL